MDKYSCGGWNEHFREERRVELVTEGEPRVRWVVEGRAEGEMNTQGKSRGWNIP